MRFWLQPLVSVYLWSHVVFCEKTPCTLGVNSTKMKILSRDMYVILYHSNPEEQKILAVPSD